MPGYFISGMVRPGQLVAWRTVIGDRRGTVENLRADGSARVRVMVPNKGAWEQTDQMVDVPVTALRHFVQAKFTAPKAEFMIQAKTAMETDLYLYGDIFSESGVDAVSVAKSLQGKDPKGRLRVYLSSPGGNPFEAVAIGSQLQRWQGPTAVYIDGIAASAATLIAVAADRAYMAPDAMYMIHRASTIALGDKNSMQHAMDTLDAVDNQMARAYARKTGKNIDDLLQMMSDETWMNSDAALSHRFIDGIVQIPNTADASARRDTRAFFDRPWFSRSPSAARWPEEPASSLPTVQQSAPPPPSSETQGSGDTSEHQEDIVAQAQA